MCNSCFEAVVSQELKRILYVKVDHIITWWSVDNFSTEVKRFTVTVRCDHITQPYFTVWKAESLLYRDQLLSTAEWSPVGDPPIICLTTIPLDWTALWLCVQLIVYTTEIEFPQKLTDCIFNCNVAENVPAVCQKGQVLKKLNVYVKYIYYKK